MRKLFASLLALALLAGCYNPVFAAATYPTNTIQALTSASSLTTFQSVIAVTGTAVQLPTNTLINGIACTAKLANAASIEFGTSTVTNTVNGTGTGAIVPAGAGISLAVSNSNLVYINGTAGDIVSCWGN